MKCCQTLWELENTRSRSKVLHPLVAKNTFYIWSVTFCFCCLHSLPFLYTFTCAYCTCLQMESSTLFFVWDFNQISHYWLHTVSGSVGQSLGPMLGIHPLSNQLCPKEWKFGMSSVQAWGQAKQCHMSSIHVPAMQSYPSSKKDREAKAHFPNWRGKVKYGLHDKHFMLESPTLKRHRRQE